MRVYDKNNNQILGEKEGRQMLKDVTKHFKRDKMNVKELFQMVDKNNDDKIDKDELRDLFSHF